MKKQRLLVSVILLIAGASGLVAQTKAPAFRVGAAKVDVTPAESELPKNIEGIHDRLHSRAIVVDNGTTSAAMITLDAGGLSDPLWQAVTTRIQSELGIPVKNVIFTATHTHAAPRMSGPAVEQKIFDSVKAAKAR